MVLNAFWGEQLKRHLALSFSASSRPAVCCKQVVAVHQIKIYSSSAPCARRRSNKLLAGCCVRPSGLVVSAHALVIVQYS